MVTRTTSNFNPRWIGFEKESDLNLILLQSKRSLKHFDFRPMIRRLLNEWSCFIFEHNQSTLHLYVREICKIFLLSLNEYRVRSLR